MTISVCSWHFTLSYHHAIKRHKVLTNKQLLRLSFPVLPIIDVHQEAHDRATEQTPVYGVMYDENAKETKDENRAVYKTWTVENKKGEVQIIQYQKILR